MIDLSKLRDQLLLEQLELAEKLVKEPDEKKKLDISYYCARVYFRIEFIDELVQMGTEILDKREKMVN